MHGPTENQRDAAEQPLQYASQVSLAFGKTPDGKAVIQVTTALVLTPEDARKLAAVIEQMASPIVIAGQIPQIKVG